MTRHTANAYISFRYNKEKFPKQLNEIIYEIGPWNEDLIFRDKSLPGNLIYYGRYPKAEINYPNGMKIQTDDKFEHFIVEENGRIKHIYLEDGQLNTKLYSDQSFYVINNDPFSTITGGHDSSGYLIQRSSMDRLVRFYDLEELLLKGPFGKLL